MLKLKKLQVLGFKSFCDRTDLRFHGDGIAAIIGPNGCGKSNISDAISWVLGEQSARSMRGTRMEDVIFAGTRDRKPTGMAEVTLTLVDPAAQEDAGAAELEPEIQADSDLSDWDEAQLRTQSAEETERWIEEVRPGVVLPGSDGDALPASPQAERSPAAEAKEDVVLRIRRRKFNTHLRAGEISVTRRLFRSGESEYLLNGKLCRLRDIQDLFMGTGLGPESYAIIEQGRIGQILSGKSGDRRLIIEEAAGITKFKARKRLSELRLEQTRQNLARINDIFEEVTRQMNSLKRQASKAERYTTLRQEMRGRCRTVLASRLVLMDAQLAELRQNMNALDEQLRGAAEQTAVLGAEVSAKRDDGHRLEQDSQAALSRISQIRVEEERASQRKSANEERFGQLEGVVAAAREELERLALQQSAAAAESDASREFLDSVEAHLSAAQDETGRCQQDLAEATRRIQSAESEQETRRESLLQSMGEISQLQTRIAQAEEALASLSRDFERLTAESGAAEKEIEALGGRRGQLGMEFEGNAECLQGLQQRIQELRQQQSENRAKETQNRGTLDSFRAQHATALGRRNSLQAVIAEHGYSTESVRRLFQSGALRGGFSPVGVLADFLEVEQQYEQVVDDFLRDELNYIVVKSWDAAEQGMRMLRTDVEGRATFLVHPEDSQARFSFAAHETDRTPPPSILVPLTHCIRVLNGFGRSLEVILPKLRDGFITPDAESARSLALENPDAFFLAPSGECFHNVTVTGGHQRSEGPLALKRELRDAVRLVEELELKVQLHELNAATLAREISATSALLEKLEQERRDAERSTMASEHALRQLESELARNYQRQSELQLQLARNREQRNNKEELVRKMCEEACLAEQRREELDKELNLTRAELATLQTRRDECAQRAAEARAAAAALDERRRSASNAFARSRALYSELHSRAEALERQVTRALSEEEQRRGENHVLEQRLQELVAEREQAAVSAEWLKANAEQLRRTIEALEEQLALVRREADTVRDQRGSLGAELARLQSDTVHLESTSLSELNEAAELLRADSSCTRLDGEALEAEQEAWRDLKSRLESMGPVNMMALEEYRETAERYSFLEEQRKDLLESIENIQSTIREIDTVSQEKFGLAFAAINENFQAAFRKLFGGGQGFMRLTDEQNAVDSGVDIIASPPGKKLQNVLLLSGGEKAMTALALLVGIFQFQPSPFCVLDEVDAPLDEANVGRFADLVREMSAQTQFVLITHSKRTMAAAPVLYGVTMQEPGVSKIVSVRFGEAAQHQQSA